MSGFAAIIIERGMMTSRSFSPTKAFRQLSCKRCVEAGGHPLSVKNRMGHSSIKVTYDRYGHLFSGMEEDLTSRMNAGY